MKNIYILILMSLLLSACVVGPDYKKPCVVVPKKFKEAPKGWKIAKPNDDFNRGQWWKIFNDPQLNALECHLNISNQTIATAAAQYRQAVDLVDEARASYFPTVSASAIISRQKQVSTFGTSSNSSSAGTPTGSSTSSVNPGVTSTTSSSVFGSSKITTFHSLLLNASWEPDIWGSIYRTIEASVANAQASDAQLALARLSAQASLAQYYFELRGVDRDQKLLNDTVKDYEKTLQLTRHRYAQGVAGRADVVLAQSQLETAQALAINQGITRGQYEHAIAVLIGVPASSFSIPAKQYMLSVPKIPLAVPSSLLERRPDIAQTERLMAQANAQIGIAISAYYPTLTLTGSATSTHTGLEHWFSVPSLGWAIGPQLAETLFDGGLRAATTAAARANYEATAATYRQTVLAAFQDVEDNLVSLRLLKSEGVVQDDAVKSAKLALQIVINEYKSGTAQYSDVITAQTAAYNAEKNASDTKYLQMTSAVGLIKSLGGGWNVCELN